MKQNNNSRYTECKIIPRPLEMVNGSGSFRIQASTSIFVSKGAESAGQYLASLLKPSFAAGLECRAVTGKVRMAGTIALEQTPACCKLGSEGYELNVSRDGIVLKAFKPAGLFYGVQTIRQMLPAGIEAGRVAVKHLAIPVCRIKDKPRFPWRGLMLDVARHMFPVEYIKKLLDLMALHKMNVLHWHLTDDQGWRIEIAKHPRLTQIGSRREASPFPHDRNILDGKPYGGFYTRKEVKEIVAYAAERCITVVPEIDMPGHMMAALACYPEMGCAGGPYKVRKFWGIADDVLCAGNENIYDFCRDVLAEVVELFPSKFIHVGGDECPKTRWKSCLKCQEMIRKLGLKDEHELQSYFIGQMDKFLNSKGRNLIGWDEILEGGLAKNAAVMSWRGIEGGKKAALLKHQAVMSPNSNCYLDYYQSKDTKKEPPAIGGFLPLETVYAYEPVIGMLPASKAKYILGVQGNIWTEYIPTVKQAEYMTFPRACAIAEVAWSPAAVKNYGDFKKRLKLMLVRLDEMKVNYRKL